MEFEDVQGKHWLFMDRVNIVENMNSIEELNHELEDHIEHSTEAEYELFLSNTIQDLQSLKYLVLKVLKRKILYHIRNDYIGHLIVCIQADRNNLEEYNKQTLEIIQNEKMNEQVKSEFLNTRNHFYQEMNEKIKKLKKEHKKFLNENVSNVESKLTVEEISSKISEAKEILKLVSNKLYEPKDK